MTFDEDEQQDDTWDDEDLEKDPESHSPAHVQKEDTNADDTESEGEVGGDYEVNAPATGSATLDNNLETCDGLKMNYCKQAEDLPDDEGTATGAVLHHNHLIPPVLRETHLLTMRCRMSKC